MSYREKFLCLIQKTFVNMIGSKMAKISLWPDIANSSAWIVGYIAALRERVNTSCTCRTCRIVYYTLQRNKIYVYEIIVIFINFEFFQISFTVNPNFMDFQHGFIHFFLFYKQLRLDF